MICYAIVVSSSTNNNYEYKLRFNISNRASQSDAPSTNLKLQLDQAIDLEWYSGAIINGSIGANTLVNNTIAQ